MKKIKMRNLKAQQEILGFVLIVVIVIIVGVIFLGISLRKDKGIEQTDYEISNFLSSSLRYSTDCAKDFEGNYLPLSELIRDCYKGAFYKCVNLEDPCDALNRTYSEMMSNLWPASDDRPIKSVGLYAYYQADIEDSGTKMPEFLEIEQGNKMNCNVQKGGRTEISVFPGYIIVELKICKLEVA